MSPNAALIEAMAERFYTAHAIDNRLGSWDVLFEAGRERWRGYAAAALDALLAVRCVIPCPECGGTAHRFVAWRAKPAGKNPKSCSVCGELPKHSNHWCSPCGGVGSVDTGPAVLLRSELQEVQPEYDMVDGIVWPSVPVFILRPRPEPEETQP